MSTAMLRLILQHKVSLYVMELYVKPKNIEEPFFVD